MLLRTSLGLASALLLFCTLGGGCQGPSPEEASSGAGGDTVGVDTTEVDSSTGDTSAADTSTTDTSTTGPIGGDPPPPAPPPGTARVRGTVVSCDTTARPSRCRIRIETVVGYGSATPPLGTGERTIVLDLDRLRGITVDSLTAAGERILVLNHAGDRPTFDEEDGDDRLMWTLDAVEQPID